METKTPNYDESLNSYIREQLKYIENDREKKRPDSGTIDAQLFYRAIAR